MTPRLRIGIAGAGVIGRAHAERIAASVECTLIGFADPAPAAAAVAADARVPLHATLAELLAARPDGVILATPNALHVAGALACIAAGVPFLVEKPVAGSLADAERLVDAERRSGVPVLVGQHRRHSAILREARAVIASGRLGRIVAVSGSATFRKPDAYFAEAPWRTQPGGGPILINLVHEIDNLRVLAGEIVEVQAMVSNAARGFEVEDSAAITLRFASGALGSFLLSDCAASPRSWEQTSGENKAYDHHPGEDCYLVAGERGSLAVPTMRLREFGAAVPSWTSPLITDTLPVAELDPLVAQLAHFCAVLRREAPPLVTAADATRTLAATLAVAESARTGRPVTLV